VGVTRILIVEDDPGLVRLQQRGLERAGYQVVTASSAAEGLARAAAGGVDLIVLDQRLPGGLSGLELYRQLRAAGHAVPAVLVTGAHDDKLLLEAMRAGVRDFVPKTAEFLDYLLPTVSRVLDQAATERQLAESRARTREALEAQHRLEQAVQEREHLAGQLQALLESTAEGIYGVDAGGCCTFMNQAALDMLGFRWEEVVGRDVHSLIHHTREDGTPYPREECPLRDVLRDGVSVELKDELLWRRDGSSFSAELSSRPLRGAAGAGAVITFRDITERKKSDEALKVTRERLDLVAHSTGLGLWCCDLPFDRLVWNARCKDHFGLPPDAEGDMDSMYGRIHPEDRDRTRQAIDRALAERSAYDVEFRTLRAGGGERWVRFIGKAFSDDQRRPLRFDGVTLDVTDRVRADQEVRRRSQQLQELALIANHLGVVQDEPAALRIITDAARSLLGAHQSAASKVPGGNWSRGIHVVSLSDKYATWRDRERVPDGSGLCRVVCRENRRLRLTQAELEAHPEGQGGAAGDLPPRRGWLAAPLLGRDGCNLGLLQVSDKEQGEFTGEDEAILVQLALIASVALENARLYQELRDTDRRKDEFLAMLGHELRNPLAPLRNALHLVRLRGPDRRQVVRDACELMERQVEHLVRLVDDLLDVSRITRGKIKLRKERVDLAAVVQRAVEGSRPLIDSRRHAFQVSLAKGPLPVEADPVRLAQVFLNLLNNAAKYTPDGGTITLRVEREGGRAAVRVRDTGTGIPPEMLPHVFELFTQVDRTLDRAEGGLGIGLTLVRHLTEMHFGTVEVTSGGPGRGTEFVVRLPLLTDEAPAAEAARPAPEAAPRRRHILVVDDNRDAAESLALLLRLFGNEVRTAYDGRIALDAAQSHRPDVVLLDIGLPGLDGLEVCRRLRAQPDGGKMLIVAMTGYGQEEDKRRSREAGFNAHLVKPVDFDALKDLLASPEMAQPGWHATAGAGR
jgi:PAS domain S-box-containing protein